MTRKTGLGKGLDALIPPSESALPEASVDQIPVENIQSNPRQPRTIFDDVELDELTASIKEHGMLQPLVVTRGVNPDEYILIAGERRLQAAKRANLERVPVIKREASDQELLELAIIENVQRADLSPLEAAEAYQRLKDEFRLSDAEIAKKVGKSRVAITNTRTLLELSQGVREALASRLISEGHARALKPLSEKAQGASLKTVIDKQLNVRQTEALVRKLKGVRPKRAVKTKASPEMQSIEGQLRDALGTKVVVNNTSKGGKIIIHYYSDEELNDLIERLT
ncbi:MAG: ParB/RepB/Spo0J family partition protein [Anaerolineae bacterium]|nr:ParB/RepB/Spo0J family partition protein [Anaerolineae bacterium]